METRNIKVSAMLLIVQLTVLSSYAQKLPDRLPIIEILQLKPIYHKFDKVKIYVKNTTDKPLRYAIQAQYHDSDGWTTYSFDITSVRVYEAPIYRILYPGQSKILYNTIGHHRILPKKFRLVTVNTDLRYGLSYYFKTLGESKIIYSNPITCRHKKVIFN